MPTQRQMLSADDLNPTDEAILDVLQKYPATPAKIAEVAGYTSGNVRNRLSHLGTHDHVEPFGGGMYRLESDPRDSSGAGPRESDEHVRAARDALRRALDELPQDVPGRTYVADAQAHLSDSVK